ncbi:glycoside hydrolase family 28 protein [Telmatospirillum sp.]|uniref:glycoside hydrolase family 28 protein n=1 Tax=Telmatospirillum sp. TaxID=2079197 RepID=UPI0028436DD8|nr:glycoside hydrolase family 28 protein [Telmatospirillum sp.]MDR3440634.1 glycoside hydrolase family 28 protein [Telmatospirillum sp.]
MREINPRLSRRVLLGSAAAGITLLGLDRVGMAATVSDPWSQARDIVNRLASPTAFPSRTFYVSAYGAVPDGQTDNYLAFKSAIVACNKAGGGHVVVTAGTWYVAGSIFLLSNVDFHLNDGATILFSANPADYAKYGDRDCGPNGKLSLQRWQGNDCINYTPLVYAYQQNNIALTGDGAATLNGGAYSGGGATATSSGWLDWKTPSSKSNVANYTDISNGTQYATLNASYGIPSSLETATFGSGTGTTLFGDEGYLPALSEAGVAANLRVFGVGHYLRPSMVHFYRCNNVMISGITTNNSPMWEVHPCLCRNVVIRNCNLLSQTVNGDGIDPESCSYVWITGCNFFTGDDPIAIKAGKNLDNYQPCQNIVIDNCYMKNSPGGVTIGSEMSGGVQNVFVQTCTIDNCTISLRIKTNMNRGGYVKNVYYRNISIPNGGSLSRGYPIFFINATYSWNADAIRTRPPVVQNINADNIIVGKMASRAYSNYQGIYIQGPDASQYNGAGTPTVYPATAVTISNSNFGTSKGPAPAFLNNVTNLVLNNVTMNGKAYSATLDVALTSAGTNYP